MRSASETFNICTDGSRMADGVGAGIYCAKLAAAMLQYLPDGSLCGQNCCWGSLKRRKRHNNHQHRQYGSHMTMCHSDPITMIPTNEQLFDEKWTCAKLQIDF